MTDPLAALFHQFLNERIYLHNITGPTRVWYETAWKAFEATRGASNMARQPPPDALLTKGELQAFVVQRRERGVSARSVNSHLQALNAFARWLHEERGQPLIKQPLLRMEKRLIATLTEAQMRRLLAYRPQGFAERRVHTLACLLLDTGLRISEGLNLTHAGVDWDNLLVTIYGKGRKERRLPFSQEMRRLLYRWQRFCVDQVPACDLMFPARNGARWGQRNSLRSLYLMQARLGLPRFGWHRVRHSFATEYLRGGGEVVRLSRMLGHTQLSTTMNYVHLLTEDLSRTHERLSILSRLR